VVTGASKPLSPDDLNGAVVSNDFPAFRPKLGRLLAPYLGWLSRTHDFVDACRAASEGTTNRVRLKEEKFAQTRIPLPPLAEQQRIVDRIERLAAEIVEAQTLRSLASEEVTVLRRSSYRFTQAWAEERGARVRLVDAIISHDSGWSPACDEIPAANGEWGVLKTTSVHPY
jgi:type I restriction enzyme S subunit